MHPLNINCSSFTETVCDGLKLNDLLQKTNINTVLQNQQFKWFLSILARQILSGSRFADSCNVYFNQQMWRYFCFCFKTARVLSQNDDVIKIMRFTGVS